MSSDLASTTSYKEENDESVDTHLIEDLDENCDLEKFKEINVKSVDLIFEDKPLKSLELLKKLETFLENKIIEMKTNVNKKLIIIILHNIACCYQKLKDYENCISYLEAVIYHFDKLIEQKHNIKINEEYFDSLIKAQNHNYDKNLLGDLILELRFCAKFHLQMSVVLSESNRHEDSLKHIKLAALICEDNLLKTTYLYNQLKDSLLNNNNENKEMMSIKHQIKCNYKIIMDLNKRILNLRNNNKKRNKSKNNFYESKSKKNMKTIYHNNYIHIKNVITKIVKNYSIKDKLDLPTNCFDSYLAYRNNEIENYIQNNTTLNDVKNIFENNFNQKDDWIKLLNIENIMYLSALNYDDLDLESDSKYELLRDSILEKVIMLSVAYYCLSNELKYLAKDKTNKNLNGEYYLYNAFNLSILFLPVSCPIISHYIMVYNKNYGQELDVIPEGEIIDYKVNIIKKEIIPEIEDENNNKNDAKIKLNKKDNFIGNDMVYFVRTEKMNRILKENNSNYYNVNSELYRSKSRFNEKELLSNDFFDNHFSIHKRKSKNLAKSTDENNKAYNCIQSTNKSFNNNKYISDNNILTKKKDIIKYLITNYEKDNSNSQISSLNTEAKENKNDNIANITNGDFGLIPNNNFIERVNKSKISDKKAPKFKLNFNNINLNNNFYESPNINNSNNSVATHMVNQLNSEKNTQRTIDKSKENIKQMITDKKNHVSKINVTNKFDNETSINIQLSHNCKTNTNINININNIDKQASDNNKYPIKNFNKIDIKNLGYNTERPHLTSVNNTNTQKKLAHKNNPESKKLSKNYISIKKSDNSMCNQNAKNINNITNISKYFNMKDSNITQKEYLTERFIVKINNKLKEKGSKKRKNTTYNSNSPEMHEEMNNQIYNNYIKKKKRDKKPIKLIQYNNSKEDITKYSALSDNQKNNLSNGNNSNLKILGSDDSNIEDFSVGQRKIFKLNDGHPQLEKINNNTIRIDKEKINKYLKNISLLKKLINHNNKDFVNISSKKINEKAFNKEMNININNPNNINQSIKKMKIAQNNKTKINSVNDNILKQNKIK